MGLALQPVTLREARRFVDAHHRHHRAPQGGLFAVAAGAGGQVVAVAIIGRPVWRAARALGYRRLITYTLAEEGGASLRAAGWKVVAQTKAEGWSRRERPRVDDHPLQRKLRWEAA